jgi:hypothetical protein
MFSGQLLVVMPNGFGLFHAGAVTRLAASAGHALAPVRAPAAATGGRRSDGPGAVSLGVLGVGALLVGLAWAASLRARPARVLSPRRPAQPSR